MENILLEIAGKELYFDVEKLSNAVKIDTKNDDGEDILHIDISKYEIYREMVSTILTYNELIDNKMGVVGLNSTSIPFKISFNTLLMKGIIKEL
jgi:hypothetical protein